MKAMFGSRWLCFDVAHISVSSFLTETVHADEVYETKEFYMADLCVFFVRRHDIL